MSSCSRGWYGPIRAATNATKTIPIVMTGGGSDPVEAGFVKSLARPGGNVTGFTNLSPSISAASVWSCSKKRCRKLPVAVLYQSGNPAMFELRKFYRSRRARWV